ncbi:MAG: hypothetical protein JSW16_04480 [Dehalococcoidales bacterium]|nr:MAG: hypothetical protein JSW16_04480 [Dehalococcoidales bacterium]
MFDIKRDMQFPYFCEACLTGIPQDDISPDDRYCQKCYDFLLEEAKSYSGKQKWAPRVPKKPKPKSLQRVTSATKGGNGNNTNKRIMSHPKRGPKKRELPIELIKQLAAEGMGGRTISKRLMTEKGIQVSCRTIQRLIAN